MSAAIGELTSDPVKEMMSAVQIVVSSNDMSNKEEALENITDLCEDLNLAKGNGKV